MVSSLVLFWGLATWRVTRMLWAERGPGDIFMRGRAYLAKKQKHMGGMYDLVSCFYCLSIWVAMIPALLLADTVPEFFGYTFVFSTLAIFLDELFKKLK